VDATGVGKHAVWLGLSRAGFGAPALLNPDRVVRGLALSPSRSEPAYRFFAGFFGVREVLLAGFILASRGDLQKLRARVAFGALADMGDTALILREIMRRHRIEFGSAFLLFSGLAGCAASTALWWEIGRVRPG
jgi:hypothetical protein